MNPIGAKPSRSQLTGVQISLSVIVAFGLILAINFNSRISAGIPLIERYESVSTEVQELRQEQATLVALRDYSQSDAFVEYWAHSEGKMVREGEILVIPIPEQNIAILPTPIPQFSVPIETAPKQPAEWKLWWALFFDTSPPFNQSIP
ncbi:MAG: hypothetical protein ACOYLB_04280 [Phototrophicaceae bacterium]